MRDLGIGDWEEDFLRLHGPAYPRCTTTIPAACGARKPGLTP
jgi:hypothetical protein